MRTVTILALGAILSATPVLAGGSHAKAGGCKGDVSAEAAKIANHGWLGIKTEKGENGAYVVKSVASGSPAQKAGFQTGDVLLALNGVRFGEENKEAVMQVKKSLSVGKQVTYTVKRAGAERSLSATLAEVPREVLAQQIGEHVLEAHMSVAVAQN
jgi:S1-C subfamily serine protease